MEVKKFVCLFLVATLGISCSMGEKDKKEERMSVRVFCAEKLSAKEKGNSLSCRNLLSLRSYLFG